MALKALINILIFTLSLTAFANAYDEEKLKDLLSKSRDLGVHSKLISRYEIGGVSLDWEYDTIIILQIHCRIKESLGKLNYRNKSLKWTIPNIKEETESVTDSNGFLRVRFTTKEPVDGMPIVIKFGKLIKSSTLKTGHYEIELPEEYCTKREIQ